MANTLSSPAVELALRALEILSARDPAGLSDLLCETAVMDFPYAPDGFTQRLEGREAIVSGLQVVPQFFASFAITPRKVMATAGGEVIVEADGVAMLQDGAPYRNSYVMIFEISKGLIKRWSEYHNPMRLPGMAG